jgi:stearoyl-CoA desaturase (delta-9 desaturase)
MSFSGLIHLAPNTKFLIMTLSYVCSLVASELYLHRSRTHRAVIFHPALCRFFRMWLWLTNFGITTKTWIAVHRKHHSTSDTADDPHSPVVHGIWTVLMKGTILYRKAAQDVELVKAYGVGVEEDWMDRNVYTKHRFRGAPLFLIVETLLFGFPTAIVIWLLQVTVLPLWCAGFIAGIAHHIGYRNNQTKDASRNFCPIGVVFFGAELHNNHHARPGSAKLSMRWWEFDSGWLVIRILSFCRLLKINRV